MKLKSTVLLLFVVSFTYQSLADASDVEVDEKENNQFPKQKPTYKPPKAQEKTFFTEVFQSEASFKKRWIYSKAKKDGAEEAIAKYDGKWSIEEPHNNPLRGDLALVLKSKAKHHAVSAKLDRPFEFTGKPFIIQYEVKFQNGIECGGAYIKLLSYHDLNQAEFHDKTPYTIMFGPDKCGLDHKLHFIFRHKNPVNGKIEEKHAKKPTANIDSYFADKRTHLYTLIVNPDSTFKILIDKGIVNEGSLLEDMSPPVNPPKEIEDLNDKKPEDWDEREKIPDPEATKPDDWNEDEPEKVTDPNAVKPEGWLDDEPELIPDPDADKPSDWDNDMDGEWEAPLISNLKCKEVAGCGKWKPPLIDNPQYKGKWRPPLIDNPNYKGVWKPRTIENPGYFEDNEPYKMMPIGAIGLELWSMTDDIMFDNFIITDNMDVADAWAADGWDLKHIEERAASTTGKSIVQAVLDATNERPWLWAVFIVVILLPIVLTIAYCCMSGSKRGMLTTLKEATDTRPWLWAVYATVLLLPIILLSICLCPKSGPIKPDDLATRKKTDKPTPDDQGKSEEEKTEVEEQKPEETPASKDDLEKEVKDDEMVEAGEKEGGAGDTNDKKPSKADLEAEQDAEDAERDADAEDDEPVEREYPRNSPRQRRPRKD